jgi:hypothetical protein
VDDDCFKLPIAPPIQAAAEQTTEPNRQTEQSRPKDSLPVEIELLRKSTRHDIHTFKHPVKITTRTPIIDNIESPPDETIDDHPVVAAVLVLLGFFSTWLCGVVMFPVGILPLIVIYLIIYNFFEKKRARARKRNSQEQRGSAKSKH